MPAASCENCGAALPKGSRFCPECGVRVGTWPGETAVEELSPDETGQVPIEYETARPRYFGVFRPGRALAPVWRALRESTGYAVESVAVHSTTRVELYRLRRELTELLAQRAESARALGEGDPQLFVLGGLTQAVVRSPRVAEERRGPEQHARDGEERAEREPHQLFAGAYLDGHFVTSVSRLATKVPWA